MEYHGKLYGKAGNKHFDTSKTSADFDNLQSENERLKRQINEDAPLLAELSAPCRAT